MTTSPFAPFQNSVLNFQVSSGALVQDSNGNYRPGVAIVQVEALLQQKRDPMRNNQPGVDTSKIWLEGYLVKVLGAETGRELILPSVVTPDSPCSAIWQGRAGKFYMEFTANNPYLEALDINLVNRIRGYFEPSTSVISGDPWQPPTPPPIQGDALYSAEYPAASNLSALRVVALDAEQLIYADAANAAHAFKVLGLLTAAVSSGQSTQALTEGPWSDPAWNWDTSKPIWVGPSGTLTQTPPESGFLLQVATATSSTAIEFEIQEAILL